MKMFIKIIFALNVFLLFGIGCAVLKIFLFPYIQIFIPKKDQYGKMISTVHYYWKFLLKSLSFFRIMRIKKVNFTDEVVRGQVIIANHPSFLDILCLIGIFNHSVCFAKSSLKNNFFFGFIVKKLYLPNDLDVSTLLLKTTSLLKEGYNIIIFPEGSRTPMDLKNKDEIRLHRSFAQIALRAGAPILPIKIEQSFPFYRKNQAWYDLGNRVCTFTFTKLDSIEVPKDEHLNLHSQAIMITEKVKNILF